MTLARTTRLVVQLLAASAAAFGLVQGLRGELISPWLLVGWATISFGLTVAPRD